MQKNLRSVIITVLFGCFLFSRSIGIAQAASPFSAIAIGPEIGTTGVGVQISTPLWPNYINLTTGYSGLGFSFHATTDNQGYNAHFRLGGAPIYLSAYPFGPQFHLDAGIFINQNRISISAVPMAGSSYIFNGHRYSVQSIGTVNGATHFNRVAPYLGLGWGNPFFGSNWTFTANAGVILEGGARSTLAGTHEDSVPGAAADINASAGTFNHHLSVLTAFPVATIGIDYRF